MKQLCVCFLSLMLGLLVQDSTAAATEIAAFYKVSSQKVNLVTFQTLKVKNRLWCASKCLQMNDVCYSFIYDLQNSTCNLGSWIYPTLTSLNPSLMLYTVGAFCNTTNNFLIQLNGSRSACLWLSNIEENYTTARARCRAKGADLSTIKTVTKFFIALAVLQPSNVYTWIGLDDIAEEGIFRWADDGSLLDSGLQTLIFAPEQPDNDLGQEDCVGYCPHIEFWPFFDVKCDDNFYFLCEMSPFAVKHL